MNSDYGGRQNTPWRPSRWTPAHQGSVQHVLWRTKAEKQPSMPKLGCGRAAKHDARRGSNLVNDPRKAHWDTRDRFEALSDTPRVPQPRRSSSGPGADRHDHSQRSTRTAGAATRARAMMDIKTGGRAGNPIATLSLRDSLRAPQFFWHQDRHIAPRRVEMARIQRPRSPRNRARFSRSRAARRRPPTGTARARRPPGRPADRAAERGRQSRALPIGSASQCTGAPREL